MLKSIGRVSTVVELVREGGHWPSTSDEAYLCPRHHDLVGLGGREAPIDRGLAVRIEKTREGGKKFSSGQFSHFLIIIMLELLFH